MEPISRRVALKCGEAGCALGGPHSPLDITRGFLMRAAHRTGKYVLLVPPSNPDLTSRQGIPITVHQVCHCAIELAGVYGMSVASITTCKIGLVIGVV